MSRRGEKQDFQLKIDGTLTPDGKPDRCRQSYVQPYSAVAEARRAAASREIRAPESHVLVTDKTRPGDLPLYEWHGPQTREGLAAGQSVEVNRLW